MSVRCQHCNATGAYVVTGNNYSAPVHACDGHLARVQREAGIPRDTCGVEDDGVDALFEMPAAPEKRRSLR